jgi:hypothetical protein
MAIIGQHHKIDYEPTLLGGKVPDFRIRSKIEVFVECKAQRFMEADAHQTFQKFGSELLSSIEKVNVVTAAWQSNFRTEVRLSRTPNSKQIQELSNILSVATLEQLIQGITVASIFKVGAVPRSQGLLKGHFQHMAHVTVSTEPTALTHENARVLVYSWPNIEKQIARTQRRLLAEARVQLRGIPAGTYGMICVQTLPNAQFRRDVHKLVEQQQFQHIPIIWVNPKMKNSRVIFRDDAGDLMHMIFDPILAA